MEGTAARGRWGSERERGQALVEFVVILPVFLLIAFGVIEFGKAFNYWINTTHLASEGARYASVRRCTGPRRASSGLHAPDLDGVLPGTGQYGRAEQRDRGYLLLGRCPAAGGARGIGDQGNRHWLVRHRTARQLPVHLRRRWRRRPRGVVDDADGERRDGPVAISPTSGSAHRDPFPRDILQRVTRVSHGGPRRLDDRRLDRTPLLPINMRYEGASG